MDANLIPALVITAVLLWLHFRTVKAAYQRGWRDCAIAGRHGLAPLPIERMNEE